MWEPNWIESWMGSLRGKSVRTLNLADWTSWLLFEDATGDRQLTKDQPRTLILWFSLHRNNTHAFGFVLIHTQRVTILRCSFANWIVWVSIDSHNESYTNLGSSLEWHQMFLWWEYYSAAQRIQILRREGTAFLPQPLSCRRGRLRRPEGIDWESDLIAWPRASQEELYPKP